MQVSCALCEVFGDKLGGLPGGQTLSIPYYYKGATCSVIMNLILVHFRGEQVAALENSCIQYKIILY